VVAGVAAVVVGVADLAEEAVLAEVWEVAWAVRLAAGSPPLHGLACLRHVQVAAR